MPSGEGLNAGRGRGGAEGAVGYSLVVVIMLVTVLNIMLAAAMPKWSEMIKRDKEEELISRGFQYAEAIRIFQKRFGRLPSSAIGSFQAAQHPPAGEGPHDRGRPVGPDLPGDAGSADPPARR